MSKHHINIDDETMAVLRSSTVTETSVKLPPGQLARPLYIKVNKVLETAGGKWNRAAQSHIFTDDPRATLGLAVDKGEILDTKKATQAFYTPPEVARAVLLHLGDIAGLTVLEPSAGRGSIAAQCLLSGALVDCVEMDPRSVEILCSTPYRQVVEGDFLKQPPRAEYDRVAMNPPFTAGQDVAHVTHAFQFLKSGGRLVAIVSPSWAMGVLVLAWLFGERSKSDPAPDIRGQMAKERPPSGRTPRTGGLKLFLMRFGA